MEQPSAFLTQLRSQRPVPWEQLPDFALYMDQILSYMDRQVIISPVSPLLKPPILHQHSAPS